MKILKKITILLIIMITFSSIGVFADSYDNLNDKDNVSKAGDDGIFHWLSREDRINSNGQFNYSFYQGLESDKFSITSSSITIYCNNSYNGTTYIPSFSLTLYEKPYKGWIFHKIGSAPMKLNGSDYANFSQLHYLDGKYCFRMDTNLTNGVDSPISGYGEISDFGGVL